MGNASQHTGHGGTVHNLRLLFHAQIPLSGNKKILPMRQDFTQIHPSAYSTPMAQGSVWQSSRHLCIGLKIFIGIIISQDSEFVNIKAKIFSDLKRFFIGKSPAEKSAGDGKFNRM
jgi:hypothetical protein